MHRGSQMGHNRVWQGDCNTASYSRQEGWREQCDTSRGVGLPHPSHQRESLDCPVIKLTHCPAAAVDILARRHLYSA